MNRRLFLAGAASLLAAPSIVRAASLMPVKALAQNNDIIGFVIDGDRLWLSRQRLRFVSSRAFTLESAIKPDPQAWARAFAG